MWCRTQWTLEMYAVDIIAGFYMTYDTTRQYVGENSSSLLIVGACPYVWSSSQHK